MSKLNKKPAPKTFRRLLSYFKASDVRYVLLIAIIGNLIYAAMDAWFIVLIKPLTDEGLMKNNMDVLNAAPLFIIGLFAARGLAAIISTYCMAWVSQNIVQKLRQQLIESYLYLPSRFFDDTTSGQLISKVTFNTQQVANASAETIAKLVREGASIIYAVTYLFYTNWRLATIYFVAVPIIAFLVVITSKRFKNVSRNIQDAMGGVTQTTQEIVEGYKVVKTFGGESYETDRFHKIVNRNRQQNLKLILTKATSVPLIQLIAALAMSVVVYYASFELKNATLTPGEFISMFIIMGWIFRPLRAISNLNSVLQQGLAGAQDIFETVDQDRELDTGTKIFNESPQTISLDKVSFSYQKNHSKVIDDLSLTIKKGETIALVGHSGSGKSTLTNLILRFYNPDSGQIFFDGTDISKYSLKSLRKNIGYVSQQVTLFNDTVKANIAYAQSEIDEARLKQAAEKAHALEFIEKMKNGFDSHIGENGSKLSGGQRQRLAIARAIYEDAPIIILDEATSALDTKSERHIQAALEALTKGRTTLIIAHRLSTIENADKIIVMDGGKIVEQGKHEELIQKNGTYARLHSIQFADD